MKLRSIRIKGWRSFEPESGVILSDLGPMNLIIGPNNVGKSNVVRFFKWLREALLTNQRWNQVKNVYATCGLECTLSEGDCWLKTSSEVEAMLAVDFGDAISELPGDAVWPGGIAQVRVTAVRSGPQAFLSVIPVMNDGRPMFDTSGEAPLVWTRDGGYIPSNRDIDAGPLVNFARCVCHVLAHCVRDVQALRHHGLEAESSDARKREIYGNKSIAHRYSSDGGDMLRRLYSISEEPARDAYWTALRRDIERWLRILLNDATLSRLESFPEDIRLTFERDNEFACRLDALGTGVTELLMLLVFLRLHQGTPLFVFIEEPEAHLHPAAALELIRILRTEMMEHQLLITTHSTSLVDGMEQDWRAFRAGRTMESGATTFAALETSQEKLGLLADLGLQPSQLFLANVIVWVEGPSDVIYLRRLLRDVDSKSRLLEGRTHTFVFYGGASLSHVAFDDDRADDEQTTERLVRCLHVASRNIIVCDADYAPQDGRLKERVRRLIDEAEALPNNHVLTTPAREIEDCVEPAILRQAVASLIDYVVIDGAQRTVVLEATDGPGHQDERFQTSLAQQARFEPDVDDSMRVDAVKRLATQIASKKVRIATCVAAFKDRSPFTEHGWAFGRRLLSAIAPVRQRE